MSAVQHVQAILDACKSRFPNLVVLELVHELERAKLLRDAGAVAEEQDEIPSGEISLGDGDRLLTQRDPHLLEMWVEAHAGTLRLLSGRAHRPAEVSQETVAEVVNAIESFISPERYLDFDPASDDIEAIRM